MGRNTRRDFIRQGCCAAAALGVATSFRSFGLVNALAQGTAPFQSLVCIFLFGGNDANNMLVPNDTTGYANYNTIRGGGGSTYIAGGSGSDFIEGGDGNNTIIGGSGNDQLFGQAGNDIDIRNAYYGPQNNEFIPAGLAVTLAPPPPGPKDTCLDRPPRYVAAPANKAASEMPAAVPEPLPAPPRPPPPSQVP